MSANTECMIVDDPTAMPPGLKHALVGGALVALVTLICAAVGVFTVQETINQFLGHLGPSAVIVASGVLTAVGPADETKLVRIEGWVAFAGGAGYVIGDTFYSHPPFGVFDGAGSAEQFHVGLTALIAAIGLFGILYVRVLRRPTALHVVMLAAAYMLLIGGHHQHSEASSIAHNASALFAALGAVFRVMTRRVEAGVCLIMTAFLFFAGQDGFGSFTALFEIDPAPWICAWAAAGAFAAAVYLAIFPDAARRVARGQQPV